MATTKIEPLKTHHVEVQVGDTSAQVEYLHRPGTKPALLCLHGFGGTKEDYADLALRDDLADRELVLVDAPGFGRSTIAEPDRLSIPLLVEVAEAVCHDLDLDSFHLLGHSMGGLTALLLADRRPELVRSLIDIEGNLAPEDCFLSRQILDYPAADPVEFLDGFRTRVAERPEFASRLYVVGLDAKIRPESIQPIFTSIVELSDHEPLLDVIGALPCPRLFVHGEQNRHLSYLDRLSDLGVEVEEITESGHFPMYSNPTALWRAITRFITRCEEVEP